MPTKLAKKAKKQEKCGNCNDETPIVRCVECRQDQCATCDLDMHSSGDFKVRMDFSAK
jgi:hypothetical protein